MRRRRMSKRASRRLFTRTATRTRKLNAYKPMRGGNRI